MLSLVLYCYSKGIRSSRRIETACLDDVGCRIITANQQDDHATIAWFLRRHRHRLESLFLQVLALCGQRGLVDLSAVAVERLPDARQRCPLLQPNSAAVGSRCR
jgi:transposase